MNKLRDKVALVTGGTTGIGFASASLFRDEGAQVIVTGTNTDTLERARRDLGDSVDVVSSDTRDLAAIDALMAYIEARHTHLDVLFANAGVGGQRTIGEADPSFFDGIFAVNVRGLYFTVQRALPLLRDGSTIVLTASVAAHLGSVQRTIYAASKAAVRSLGRGFAAELLPRNIRVNTLTPGPTETAIMQKSAIPAAAIAESMRQRVPMKRLGQPAEAAAAALFLAGPDSTFMTGAEIVVSGGLTDI